LRHGRVFNIVKTYYPTVTGAKSQGVSIPRRYPGL